MKSWNSISSTVNKLNNFYNDISCSNFRLHLQVLNPTIYQRGLCEEDFKLSTPPILRGIVVVQIITPTKISDISVIFHGEQGETIIEFEAIDVLEPLFAKRKKTTKLLVNELFTWDYQYAKDVQIGTYTFPFHFIIDTLLPESFISRHLNICYRIEACLKYETNNCGGKKTARKDQKIKLVRCVPDTLFNDSILATGNWRDLLVYEFSFQNKIAFQESPFLSIFRIYPIEPEKQYFTLHGVSIWIVQNLTFDKYVCSNYKKKYTETDKILLYKRMFNFQSLVTKNGSYNFEICLKIPSNGVIYDKSNQKLKKTIYPSINNANEGFISSHTLKVTVEVSECERHNQIKNKQTYQVSRTNSTFSSSSEKSMDALDSVTFPGYTNYHEKRTDATRFKKIELSFTAPIKLLSHDSEIASESPPCYSDMQKRNDNIVMDMISANKFDIVPPAYDEETAL